MREWRPEGQMEDVMKRFFFDSWGGLWTTCDGYHPDAQAFGPSGVSRRATDQEAELPESPDQTPWSVANSLGRIEETEEGWSFLREV